MSAMYPCQCGRQHPEAEVMAFFRSAKFMAEVERLLAEIRSRFPLQFSTELMLERDVATFLGIAEKTLQNRRANGEQLIESKKIGTQVLYSAREVAEYVAKRA